MAYQFTAASTQYVTGAKPADVSSHPITMACWYDSSWDYNYSVFFSLDGNTGFDHWMLQQYQPTAYAFASGGGGGGNSSTLAFTTGPWRHFVALFGSTTSRYVYVDATAGTENTNANDPGNIETVNIGAWEYPNDTWGTPADGPMAECAIWTAALTDAEIASLYKGFKPHRIRPQSLAFYGPLLRNLVEMTTAQTLTAVNTPTVADHPRVY